MLRVTAACEVDECTSVQLGGFTRADETIGEFLDDLRAAGWQATGEVCCPVTICPEHVGQESSRDRVHLWPCPKAEEPDA